MELVYMFLPAIAGGVVVYSIRATIANDLAAVTADFKAEVTKLRADIGKLTTKL